MNNVLKCFISVLLCAAATVATGWCEEPQKATLRQLKSDPQSYNHRLVEVTGFVSHAFEDFTIFDPACGEYPNVWLEYGGTVKSGTMYCCGVPDDRKRHKELQVENIQIPLVNNERFQEFENAIQPPFRSGSHGAVVHATIVARFFSGEKRTYPRRVFWGGYGHMGCCSLLAIQEVKAVDTQPRNDLDLGAEPDQPDIDKTGCGYTDLLPLEMTETLIQWQRDADEGKQEWVFDDPRRVALGLLSKLSGVDEERLSTTALSREGQGRKVYKWFPRSKGKESYMVVVSRPYLSSFYARDARRVAWVATAAYRSSCKGENSVTRIK